MLKKVRDVHGNPMIFRPTGWKRLYVTRFSPVYLRKRRYYGERDLLKLAREEKSEALWLYCHDDSTWYGIGGLSVERETGPEVIDYVFDYSQLGRRFSRYHTHIKSFVEKSLEDFQRSKKKGKFLIKRRFLDDYAEKASEVLTAIPSTNDVRAGLRALKRLSTGSLDFRIASPYGITNIDYEVAGQEERILREYAHQLSDLLLNELPRIVQESAEQRGYISIRTETLIRRSVSFLNDKVSGIRLSFRPVK